MIRGTLEYLTWDRPWYVDTDSLGTKVDLRALFWLFAKTHRNQPARRVENLDSLVLKIDAASNSSIQYGHEGEGIALVGDTGYLNLLASIESALHRLNARAIVIEITETIFQISADPEEQVLGVRYCGRGNSARIPVGEENTTCGISTERACIFLTLSHLGFHCEKFNAPAARVLLERKAKGTMRATRIGNCALLGREGMPPVTPTEGTPR